jgi:CRISPR-associated protein Cas5d
MKTGDIGNLALIVEDNRQQRASTVLTEVAYVICARFALTPKAGADDNEGKHLDTFNRRARKGQCFHQPCLGTREFPAQFELIEPGAATPKPTDETSDLGFGSPRDLGFMLYDIDHAGDRGSLFFRATLDHGVMRVPSSDSPEIRR